MGVLSAQVSPGRIAIVQSSARAYRKVSLRSVRFEFTTTSTFDGPVLEDETIEYAQLCPVDDVSLKERAKILRRRSLCFLAILESESLTVRHLTCRCDSASVHHDETLFAAAE